MGRSGSDESRQPEGALAAQVPGTHGTCKAPVLSVIGHVVAIVLVIASIANLLAHLPSYRRLSQSHDTRRYVQTVLRDAPEGAVILSNWHWFTPLRYAQQIEGVRPDVMVEYVPPRGEPLAQTWVRRIEEHISARPVVVARVFEHEYGALPYAFEPLGEAFLVRSEPRTGVPSDMIALDEVLGGVAGRETGQNCPSHSEKQIELLGYRLGSEEIRPAQPLTVELAWSPRDAPSTELALFAQLIGPDGELWSTAEDLRHPAATLSTGEVVVDRFVVYPRLHAPPGAYSLVVGGYPIGASNGGRFRTAEGEDDVLLQTVQLQPSRTRPVTNHPLFVRFAGGPTLIGVDYETGSDGGTRTYLHWAGPSGPADLELRGKGDAPVKTSRVPALRRGEYASVGIDGAGGWSGDQPQQWLGGQPQWRSRLVVLGQTANRRWNLFFNGPIHLPAPRPGERYVPFGNAAVLTHVGGPRAGLEPGTEATLSLRFDAQRPLQRDYIVSTSLTGLNADGTWAWRVSHDTVPALGAIPTLKWIHDSSVLDPHRMDVPQETPAVPVRGSLQVYDHFTQRSLPSLDGRHGLGVELGSWRVPQ